MGLLDGELQATIHEALSGIMLDVAVGHFTGGSVDPTTQKRTGVTETAYTVKGFRDDSSTFFTSAGLSREGDMTVMLLQDSRSWSPSVIAPFEGDKVTVQSETGTVMAVHQDPAQATYVLDCKR